MATKIAYTGSNTKSVWGSSPKINCSDDVSSCGQRKYLRLCVTDPLCLTVFGLNGQSMIVEQLFGKGTCVNRKALGMRLSDDNCEIVICKPGRYEVNMEDYGLFPPEFQWNESKLTAEQAALIKGGQSYALY